MRGGGQSLSSGEGGAVVSKRLSIGISGGEMPAIRLLPPAPFWRSKGGGERDSRSILQQGD